MLKILKIPINYRFFTQPDMWGNLGRCDCRTYINKYICRMAVFRDTQRKEVFNIPSEFFKGICYLAHSGLSNIMRAVVGDKNTVLGTGTGKSQQLCLPKCKSNFERVSLRCSWRCHEITGGGVCLSATQAKTSFPQSSDGQFIQRRLAKINLPNLKAVP